MRVSAWLFVGACFLLSAAQAFAQIECGWSRGGVSDLKNYKGEPECGTSPLWRSSPAAVPIPQGEKANAAAITAIIPQAPQPRPASAMPTGDWVCEGLLEAVDNPSAWCLKAGSGRSFKDCSECPDMVVAPPGRFMMGSPGDEPEQRAGEGPQHDVTIKKPFALGKFTVTFAQWDACAASGGCGGYRPKDEGWGRGDRPVMNISWNDAKAYVAWLSARSGKQYRLPTEAEREYATRAGTATPFWWGATLTPEQANYDGTYVYKGGGEIGENRQKTLPVNSFEPNPWGLYQVHGNVYDWVEDCMTITTKGPSDSSPQTKGNCINRALKGGCWSSSAAYLRAAYRTVGNPTMRTPFNGLRVARSIEP